MHDLLNKRTVISVAPTPTDAALGPVVFTSTGDKYIFTPANPIDVYRWGLITNALLDVGAGFVLALDFRPTAGSDTNRVEMSTISTGTTDVAAGKMVYNQAIGADNDGETAEDGTLRNVAPTGPIECDPGEELVIEVTNAADTAGTGYVFIEYVELPAQGTRNANAIEKTS